MQSFYCSPKYQLERLQISATNKLWCISPCLKESNQEHYMCKYGIKFIPNPCPVVTGGDFPLSVLGGDFPLAVLGGCFPLSVSEEVSLSLSQEVVSLSLSLCL